MIFSLKLIKKVALRSTKTVRSFSTGLPQSDNQLIEAQRSK